MFDKGDFSTEGAPQKCVSLCSMTGLKLANGWWEEGFLGSTAKGREKGRELLPPRVWGAVPGPTHSSGVEPRMIARHSH